MKKNRRYLWWGVAAIGAVLVSAWYFLPALLSGRGFTAPATGGSSSSKPSNAASAAEPALAAEPSPAAEPSDPYSVSAYWLDYWDDPERGPVDAALAWWTDTTYYSGDN